MHTKVKAGTGARRKGQLSALLAEAYENRASIEEKLAEGRRNRKEGGMKYGESDGHIAGVEKKD